MGEMGEKQWQVSQATLRTIVRLESGPSLLTLPSPNALLLAL